MLELKSVIFTSKDKNKKPLDLSFSNGLNYIEYVSYGCVDI